PTAGIDVAHQIKVMGAARRQADAGSAVLASLHDLSLAAAYADRVIVMRAGRIVSDDAPEAALTTTLLSEVYGAPLDAVRGPDGALIIAPRYA
ncbi:MAG: hemin ABC transporter ATP-binding protein, partial [Pseudomonadota bacterium]